MRIRIRITTNTILYIHDLRIPRHRCFLHASIEKIKIKAKKKKKGKNDLRIVEAEILVGKELSSVPRRQGIYKGIIKMYLIDVLSYCLLLRQEIAQ